MKKVLLVTVMMCSGMVIAEGASNPWRLTVGPAWRSRTKAVISGNVQADAVSASHTVTYYKDIAGKTSWGIGDVTTFTYEYTIEGVITEYGDISELNWIMLGEQPMNVKNVEINISLPWSKYSLKEEYMFFHGTNNA